MPEKTTLQYKQCNMTTSSSSGKSSIKNEKNITSGSCVRAKPSGKKGSKPATLKEKKKLVTKSTKKIDSKLPKKKIVTKKTTKKQGGGASTNCSGSYNPSKSGIPAVVSGMASRGTTNATFNSTTPTADLTPISFDYNYNIFPSTTTPSIGAPLPLYNQSGKGCGCKRVH
jgi:hypothetical protein